MIRWCLLGNKNMSKNLKILLLALAIIMPLFFISATALAAEREVRFLPQMIGGLPGIVGNSDLAWTNEGYLVTPGNFSLWFKAFYMLALNLVGILAALAIMIGGFKRMMAFGNGAAINESTAWIVGAVKGLILAFSTYTFLYLINPDLVIIRDIQLQKIKLEGMETVSDAHSEYSKMDCPKGTEGTDGFKVLVTGYCRPPMPTFGVTSPTDIDNFYCSVGLNCGDCPSGRSATANCGNSVGFAWKGCKPFTTGDYCTKTASGNEPKTGEIAADWNCFAKGSTISIPGLKEKGISKAESLKVTDKGSAIKGRRFDVWTGTDCNKAKELTGTYTATQLFTRTPGTSSEE